MLLRIVLLIFSIPSLVLSEVGFRDLKVGQTLLTEVEKYCLLEEEYFSETLNELVRNFECYGNDDYSFQFESSDGDIVSDISIFFNSSLPSTFYVDRGSKFWGIRNSLSEKYRRLECNEQSFEKLILGEIIYGVEYYVNSTSDGNFDWIQLMVVKRYLGDRYNLNISYYEENHDKDNKGTDIYMRNCGGDGFKVDEF